jgi:outer membrane protein
MVMNGKKMTVWVGMVILLGAWLVGPGWTAELKIGSVDIQKAINECQAGKDAKKKIMAEVEKFQRQVGDKQKELQALKESLDKQSAMLTADARGAKEKDYQNKLKDFQRWGEDTQNELNQKRMEMERKIAVDLFRVVQKIGADDNYTVILEKNENLVLFANKSTDLTDRVIKAYDVQKK